jgi:AhpD family alkylhydroperoxidase
MEGRMKNPVMVIPAALDAMRRLAEAGADSDIPMPTHFLVWLRASQINGCSVCVDIHARELGHSGEPVERIAAVAAWREAPYFTEPERAALALTEASTRLADRPGAVPDDVWEEATRHYDERQLAALVISIAEINAWNRILVTTQQISGDWVEAYTHPAAHGVAA